MAVLMYDNSVALVLFLYITVMLQGNVMGSCTSSVLYTLPISDYTDNPSITYNSSSPLNVGYCDKFVIDPDDLAKSSCFENASSILMIEFWRYESNSNETNDLVLAEYPGLTDVFLMAARNVPPVVSISNKIAYFTPKADAQYNQTAYVTFLDFDGLTYSRAYQRVLAPSSAYMYGTDWYVVVANFNPTNVAIPFYQLRATCVPAAEPPCPSPSPSLGPCMDRGSCIEAQVTSLDGPYCNCDGGYGDFGCNIEVTTLENNKSVFFNITPGGWSYFEFWLPSSYLDQDATEPEVLVSMQRYANFSGKSGGDPILIVKPWNTSDHSIPNVYDISSYSDYTSFDLLQSYHYLMMRSVQVNRYYVGIFNNEGRDIIGEAHIALEVKFTNTREGSPMPFFCPLDCSGNGQCVNPASRMTSQPPLLHYFSEPFWCLCNPGWGGTFCDGKAVNVSISSNIENVFTEVMPPGTWTYFIFNVDPRNFDFSGDVIDIDWHTIDGSDPEAAFVTVVQNYFPLDQVPSGASPPKGTFNIFFYHDLYVGGPSILQLHGSSLQPSSTYILAIYNTQYIQSFSFACQVEIYVPMLPSSWIRPYLSAVVGVAAAAMLCLLMVMCRRMMIRRRLEMGGMNGQGSVGGPWWVTVRDDVRPISSRRVQRGVPQGVIDTFEVYELCLNDPEQQKARSEARRNAVLATIDAQPASTSQNPEPSSLLPQPSTSLDQVAIPLQPVNSSSEEFSCTICLCEYEEGEQLRRLPCRHEFHKACIDKWMAAKTTCPMCRTPLVAQPEVPEQGTSRTGLLGRPLTSDEASFVMFALRDVLMRRTLALRSSIPTSALPAAGSSRAQASTGGSPRSPATVNEAGVSSVDVELVNLSSHLRP